MSITNLGPVTQVNTIRAGANYPDSATLSDGRYVVAWLESNSSQSGAYPNPTYVNAQLFSSAGAKIGSTILVSDFGGVPESQPSVTALADGGFLISYTRSVSSSEASVAIIRYNANGDQSLGETAIDASIGGYASLSQTVSTDAGYAVAYVRDFNGVGKVALNLYDLANNQIGSTVIVNDAAGSAKAVDGVVQLNNGTIVVLWEDSSTSPSSFRTRLYSSAGEALGQEFSLSSGSGGSAEFDRVQASIAALDTGGYAAVWSKVSGASTEPDLSGLAIQSQIFNADGVAITRAFVVDTTVQGAQVTPTITALTEGRFIVGWSGPPTSGLTKVFAQVVGYDGANGPEFYGAEAQINPNSDQTVRPSLSGLPDGRIVVTWADLGRVGIGSRPGIFQQIVDPLDGIQQGTADPDVIYGAQNAPNEIHGLESNDVIFGGLGSDRLFGGGGSDLIDSGLAGIDRLYGGTGDDNYIVHSQYAYVYENRGEGFDTIYADGTDFSMTLNAAGSFVEALVMRSADHTGTGTYINDLLIAQADRVQLFGGFGNDTLVAYGQDDTLYGSMGEDIYVTSTRSVSIREAAREGRDTVYADNTDFSLADAPNVENLVLRGNNHVAAGSEDADLLISAGISNQMYGGGGNDTFSFTQAHGATQVLDFDARPTEHDMIAFARAQFVGFGAVQTHLAQVGTDTVITAADGSGDTYVLHNVAVTSLSASDFLFY